MARGAVNHLHKWYLTAEGAKIDMARNQTGVEEIPTPRELGAIQTASFFRTKLISLFQVWERWALSSGIPAKKPEHLSGGKPTKPSQQGKETTLRRKEIVEFQNPPLGDETSVPQQEGQSQTGSDLEDNLLVSDPIKLLALPLRLFIPGQEYKDLVLLDS
ncbi:hypothetical protein E2320_019892, partial [Naja naja]